MEIVVALRQIPGSPTIQERPSKNQPAVGRFDFRQVAPLRRLPIVRWIRVLTGDDRRAVEVIDDGAGVTSGAPDGSGLAGLRERAALVGGELQAGPLAGGGFRLALSVPGPGAVARSGDPS